MMVLLVVLLLAAASIAFGLRATALVIGDTVHPIDRLALAAMAGALITAVILEASAASGVFEMGLGLVLSLSPVGPFDLTKWWFRSRGRRSAWLTGSGRPALLVALRYLAVAGIAGTCLAAYAAMAAALG